MKKYFYFSLFNLALFSLLGTYFIAQEKTFKVIPSTGKVSGEMDTSTVINLPEAEVEVKTVPNNTTTEMENLNIYDKEDNDSKESSDDDSDSLSNNDSELSKDNLPQTKSEPETQENSSIDVTPNFHFTSPSAGQTVHDTLEIKGKVEMAKNVELYLVPLGSNTQKYIGSARQVKTSLWAFRFDSSKFPNGSFYLIAKIKNAYGVYASGKTRINIDNQKEKAEEENQSELETTSLETSLEQNVSSEISQTSSENVAPKEKQDKNSQNYNGHTPAYWQKKYFKNEICQKKDYCGADADPDNDRLSNKEEFNYKTNPLNPDCDSDGYLDGDEIKNGFNPLKYSPGDKSDKIIFESPKENGPVQKDLYQVSKVNLEKEKKENGTEEKKIILKGKGLPNSFVNIYIYSSLPIILTVKTDASGNWSYSLDKQLEDGKHEVYVAVTDNTGKITAKSEPLFFVKTAEAIETIPSAEATFGEKYSPPVSPTEDKKATYVIALIAIISFSLVVSIVIIGIYAIRSKFKD